MSGRRSAWPLPLWIAHRGAGKLAPENTLAAFRLGAQFGYRAFECDVKLSADEVPFLLHDATLDRTSDQQGVAGDRPWSELSSLDAGSWHSRAYAGEPPPTLAAIATYCRRNGFALDLEIKPTPGADLRTGVVVGEAVKRLWAGSATLPLFSSFRPEALQGARESAPDVPRALLLDTLWPGWLDIARSLDVVAVITNYKVMDQALIAELHGLGWKGLCYTVNDEAEVARLLSLRIDGLVTDAVDRFSADETVRRG